MWLFKNSILTWLRLDFTWPVLRLGSVGASPENDYSNTPPKTHRWTTRDSRRLLIPTLLMLRAPPAQDNPSQTTLLQPALCSWISYLTKVFTSCKGNIQIQTPMFPGLFKITSSSQQCSARYQNASTLWAPSFLDLLSTLNKMRDQPYQANSRLGLCAWTKRPNIPEYFVLASTTSLLLEIPPNQNPIHLSDNLDNAFSFIRPSTSVFGQHSCKEPNLFLEHWMKSSCPIRPWSWKLPKLNGWNLEQHNCAISKNSIHSPNVVLRSIANEDP